MKKLLMVTAVPLALLAAVCWLPVAGGCGLFDSGGIRVNVPTQTFAFDLDAGVVKTELEQYLQGQGISVDLSGKSEIPPEVGELQYTVEMETPPEQVDLSNEEDLKKYVEAGKVKSVEIKSIRYVIEQNTLNFDMPRLDVYMGGFDAQDTSDAALVAVIDSITAGWTGQDAVQFAEGGRETMSSYLLGYKFAFIGKADITIDTAVTRTIPDGLLAGRVEVDVQFTVDPL